MITIRNSALLLMALILFVTPAYAVSVDTTGTDLWVSSNYYNVSVSNNTGYTSFGMITSTISNYYNSTDIISDGYVANYLRIGYYQGASLNFVLIAQRKTPTACYVDENGTYRAKITCQYGATINNTWYLYDEFYLGRLTTVGYSDTYQEALDIFLAVNDSNATGGYDRAGLSSAYGTAGGAFDTTASATTTTYDTFNDDNNYWSAWYGTSTSNLAFGMLGKARIAGTNSAYSYTYDIETTGSDYFRQTYYLDGTNILANIDQMWVIGNLYNGSSSNFTRDMYSVYNNPAVIDGTSNISNIGFCDKCFSYQLQQSNASAYAQWNVTGNASWQKTAEKIYFTIYNTTKDKQLFLNQAGSYSMLLANTSIQWETNGSYYNAIFPITQNTSNETTYYFGNVALDADGDGWNATYDCNDFNYTIKPIANNTRTYLNSSITLCPGTYYNASMHINVSNAVVDGNGANLTSTYNCTSEFIIGLYVNDTAYNITFRNFITDGLCEAIQTNIDTTNITIYNNTIIRSKYAGIIVQSNISNEYSRIYNNTIMHQYRTAGEQVGIHTFIYGNGGGYKIYNNTIHNITQSGSYGYGVYLRDLYGTGAGNTSVYNNTITNCNRGFYLTGGSYNYIYNNTIRNMTTYGILGNGNSFLTYILNNTIENVGLRGIYLLSYSNNYTIDGNIIRNAQMGVRTEADYLTLSNNRIYNCSDIGFYSSYIAQYGNLDNNYMQDIKEEAFYLSSPGYQLNGNIVNNSSIPYMADTFGGYVGAVYTNNIDLNTGNISFYSYDDDIYITNHTSNDENYDAYSYDMTIRNLTTTPPIKPNGLKGSGNYIVIGNTTNYGDEYADINLYYNETYVYGLINESTLRMYYHNGTDWENVTDTGINEAGDYVYGNNLTQSGIYGLFGEPLMLVEIIDPMPIEYVGVTSLPLNVVESDGLVDTWWYSLNNATNTTFTPNTTLTNLTIGNYTLFVYVNCTLGNVYYDYVDFSIRDKNVCDFNPIFSILPWILLLIVVIAGVVMFASGKMSPGSAIFFLAVGAVLILAIIQYGSALCG